MNELNRISLVMNDLFYYISSIVRIYVLHKLENNEELPRFTHSSQICGIPTRNMIRSDVYKTWMR